MRLGTKFFITISAVILLTGSLAACGTINGIGQDIQQGGAALSSAAVGNSCCDYGYGAYCGGYCGNSCGTGTSCNSCLTGYTCCG